MEHKSDLARVNRIDDAGDFPAVVLIDNINACNLRCSMCDHVNMRQHRPTQRMPMALYHRIIDEIAVANPGARVWEVFFGEPFLDKQMAERVGYAKQRGLTDVVLNSNGTLLSEARARAVIQAGLDALYVGIDAATPESYARIRIKGDFHRTVENVLGYHRLLREVGRPEQKLFVQFVVNEFNEHEVEAFKSFWHGHGIPTKIRPKVSWAGLIDAGNLHDNDAVTRKPCYWLMRTINICADGSVALCSVDVHARVKAGNVLEQSIRGIWQGGLRRFRELHQQGRWEELPEMCRSCRDWQSTYAEFN